MNFVFQQQSMLDLQPVTPSNTNIHKARRGNASTKLHSKFAMLCYGQGKVQGAAHASLRKA